MFNEQIKTSLTMKILLGLNIAAAIFLILNQILYLVSPDSLIVTILGVLWELGIIPIIGFMLISVVMLFVKLLKKDFSLYAPVLLSVVFNIFLLFILPYLIE
ncbi:hypothetical protein C5749_12350 [Sphingobacterium gobiense]|uniref:Uncharacterized protein n=1 Tax=Sphingobacterium gobiense TaxID=1382456 RepID=A0A2S9JM90_9SPHI|nr:hypothetical protein C5749_12350 [Sphingobacterium gobiense]